MNPFGEIESIPIPFPIESGIPVPTIEPEEVPSPELTAKMLKVGESFLMTSDDPLCSSFGEYAIFTASCISRQNPDKKFISRLETTGLRIWRTL